MSAPDTLPLALDYLTRGWSVIPVKPGGKEPLVAWQVYQTKRATAAEVKAWWTQWPDANVGIVTGAISGLIVLDLDGQEGITSVKSVAPEWTIRTPAVRTGKGSHVYFAHPGGIVLNRTRLLPGVDIRGDGGFVVAPPSRHASGARYLWGVPSETPLTPIPDWLLILLSESVTTTASEGEPIPNGTRDSTLYRIGRSLHAKKMSASAILAALRAENLEKCQPPLPDAEVKKIARNATTQADRPDFVRDPDDEAPQRETPALQVPEGAMIGIARDFADLYSTYLESPKAFFYFAFLTQFGAIISKKVKMASVLHIQPRLYTVLVGESAQTRKSTALGQVDAFFKSLYPVRSRLPWVTLHGVGSAEGLAEQIKKSGDPASLPFLLHYDELRAFVQKGKIDSSVLLPMVNTLFERPEYDNVTKQSPDGRHGGLISVRDASLSVLAACTMETYSTMFTDAFLAIGFPNRLWLVADKTDKLFPIPGKIPPEAIDKLRDRTRAILKAVDAAYRANNREPVEYHLSPGAERLFTEWYLARTDSLFGRRLDTYGHRLALVLAVTTGQTEITEEVMVAVVNLLENQLEIRRECDPIYAENKLALMEEKIRRVLARGPVEMPDLKRRVNYTRYGLWVWNMAINNLKTHDEIGYDSRNNRYFLAIASKLASAKKST